MLTVRIEVTDDTHQLTFISGKSLDISTLISHGIIVITKYSQISQVIIKWRTSSKELQNFYTPANIVEYNDFIGWNTA